LVISARYGFFLVPTADIERRFGRSLSNLFEVFSLAVDNCRCYMNIDTLPELIFEQQGELRSIVHAAHYQHLLEQAIP
jgi:predicted ABC-type ATPase